MPIGTQGEGALPLALTGSEKEVVDTGGLTPGSPSASGSTPPGLGELGPPLAAGGSDSGFPNAPAPGGSPRDSPLGATPEEGLGAGETLCEGETVVGSGCRGGGAIGSD